MLNAYCTFRLFLKVSLLQGVNTLLQSELRISLHFDARFCVLLLRLVAGDALN